MVDRTNPGSLYEQALSVAQDVFDRDESGVNADKVCAVALDIRSDTSVAFFSGAPGYKMLVKRKGGSEKEAQRTITDSLTRFLRQERFTDAQIKNHGFDLQHN